MPLLAENYWPSILEYLEKEKINFEVAFFIGGTGIQLVLLLVCNLWFELLYRLENPFIEQFRTESEPWPWVSNPKLYRELTVKSIWMTLFNNIIMTGVLRLSVEIIGLPQK